MNRIFKTEKVSVKKIWNQKSVKSYLQRLGVIKRHRFRQSFNKVTKTESERQCREMIMRNRRCWQLIKDAQGVVRKDGI